MRQRSSLTATLAIHAETAPQALVPTVVEAAADDEVEVMDATEVVAAADVETAADEVVATVLAVDAAEDLAVEEDLAVDATVVPAPRALFADLSKRLFS